MPEKLQNLSRMCMHTMTTKSWTLQQALEGYARADIPAITVWREHLQPYGAKEAGNMLKDSGLHVVSLCQGGSFPATSGAAREEARNETRRAIDEAAAIGAPLLVLMCGAVPGLDLAVARQHILDGINTIIPHAKDAGVKLAIEPQHPMYADNRSAINTLEQASNMVYALQSDWVGLTIDVYHLWWDPYLRAEIARCKDIIFSFHVADWRTPTRDLLNDRAVMGDGCINIPEIRGWVEKAGFTGFIEVEIFSEDYWAMDQDRYLRKLKNAYLLQV